MNSRSAGNSNDVNLIQSIVSGIISNFLLFVRTHFGILNFREQFWVIFQQFCSLFAGMAGNVVTVLAAKYSHALKMPAVVLPFCRKNFHLLGRAWRCYRYRSSSVQSPAVSLLLTVSRCENAPDIIEPVWRNNETIASTLCTSVCVSVWQRQWHAVSVLLFSILCIINVIKYLREAESVGKRDISYFFNLTYVYFFFLFFSLLLSFRCFARAFVLVFGANASAGTDGLSEVCRRSESAGTIHMDVGWISSECVVFRPFHCASLPWCISRHLYIYRIYRMHGHMHFPISCCTTMTLTNTDICNNSFQINFSLVNT